MFETMQEIYEESNKEEVRLTIKIEGFSGPIELRFFDGKVKAGYWYLSLDLPEGMKCWKNVNESKFDQNSKFKEVIEKLLNMKSI